ncbi:MAG TPA: hypothetical protein VD968_02020, partial [Pyrinomonadaceae bacterium]|nr:hypothetical protein [Pyrinomonadaceae bacterium]
YDPQKPSENFPAPWRGGPWGMGDITNYMTRAAFELLKHAADNRERWLRRFYEVGREAVRPRRPGELQGFRILPSENSGQLLDILRRGGVEMETMSRREPGRRRARGVMRGGGRAGADWQELDTFVPLAQPYGAFAKALLERQNYPDLRDASGNPLPPYDVTAHTLPLLMGVEVEPVYQPVRRGTLLRDESAEGGRAPTRPDQSRRPRVALYRSHVPSMDEGWTRWVFEDNGISSASITDAEVRAGRLREKYDAVVIPDQSPRAILEGHRKGAMPDEFTGGLGKDGVKALREFVAGGGTLVCLNRASNFAIEQFDLPLRDVTEGLRRTEFYVPGSILRTVLDTTHPLSKGMPRESIAWVEDSPVFEIKSDPLALPRVKIIARYPHSGSPLLSGWLLGEERLRGRAALVEAGLGEGRVILFGFRPQYRAQSLATYPLLFNALAPSS